MLLINPDCGLYRHLPPLALAYLATKNNVRVFDQNTKPDPKDRFLKEKTDLIGLFIRPPSLSESQRIARTYKKKFPRGKIASVYSTIDVQCSYPTLQLPETIADREIFSDSFPFPRFELFDSFDIFQKNWQKGKWAYPLMTSSGCPFRCIFCVGGQRTWHARSAKNCFQELKEAKKNYRIQSFQILDEVFNLDKKRVLEFCRLIAPLKLSWSCANGLRADLFDKDQARAMKKAGCRSVAFGVESTDDNVLKNIKKGENFAQIKKALQTAGKYFPKTGAFFIIGLPGSTYQKDLQSLSFAVQNNLDYIFSYYVPFDQKSAPQVFYGHPGSKPVSAAYKHSDQQKIYDLVKFRYLENDLSNLPVKFFGNLKLIWQFDRKNIIKHFFKFLFFIHKS